MTTLLRHGAIFRNNSSLRLDNYLPCLLEHLIRQHSHIVQSKQKFGWVRHFAAAFVAAAARLRYAEAAPEDGLVLAKAFAVCDKIRETEFRRFLRLGNVLPRNNSSHIK